MQRKISPQSAFVSLSLIVLVILNFWAFPRDGVWTSSVGSFDASEIVANKYWSEAPVQVMNTFMTNGAYVVGAQGLSFTDRLILSFGKERVDVSQPPIDVRESLTNEEILKLYDMRRVLSYRSDFPCPHDRNETCTIGVGWNRNRTKEPDIRMIVMRIGERDYLIWDDSLVNSGGEN